MSREIKFRAWITNLSIPFMAVQGEPDIETLGSFFHHYCGSEQEKLMQFTGLKDQKGNDIYEGDIIGDWTDVDGKMEQSKLTVYFDEMLGQWMLDNSSKQDKTISYSLFSELQDFEYEIIGNIYENPDLLPT